MEQVKGKYGQATIYATVIDDGTLTQIKELLDQKFTKDLSIKIMADCHSGKGCVIGTTMNLTNCVVPSLVGVDIGCGMLTIKLNKMDINLIKLDRFIRKKIPSGIEVYNEEISFNTNLNKLKCYEELSYKSRIKKSMGTLGGGNHFIEIDKDDEENLYLIIHTGSRNLGKQIAEFYCKDAYKQLVEPKVKSLINRYKRLNKEQKIQDGILKLREKYSKYNKDLIPLYGKNFKNYLHDMEIAQDFARENREVIANKILNYLGLDLKDLSYFHTTHNYINMDDMILRKGSIAAYENTEVLIPINMKDGAILAKGKSNCDYNYSAPHGAGRLLSRKKAKENIKLEDFKKAMEGIYSTSVQIDTLDESPFAYKSIDDIIPNIKDTVEIIKIIKPIYNFKACKRERND